MTIWKNNTDSQEIGTVIRSANPDASMTRPAVGKDGVYSIHVPWRYNQRGQPQLSVERLKIFDVNMLSEVPASHGA